jgi:hypothetical protein
MKPVIGQDSGPGGEDREEPVRVAVAVLGKHPAFDDYLDGVGADSPFVQRANRELIWDGIGELVDRGRWVAGQVVPGKAPEIWVFLWQQRAVYLIGAIGPSRDRRGRAHVMVLAAEVSGIDVFWGEEALLPLLTEAFRDIRNRSTEEEFFAAVGEVERKAISLARNAAGREPDYPERTRAFLERPWLKSPPESLCRVLHVVRQNFRELAATSLGGVPDARPHFELLRLPCAEGDEPALAGWCAVLRGQIHNHVPILLARPEGLPWADAVLGRLPSYPDPHWLVEWGEQPPTRTMGCLQMDGSVVTPESLEPYVIEPGFDTDVQGVLEDLGCPWGSSSKRTVFGDLSPGARPALPGEAARTREGRRRVGTAPSKGAQARVGGPVGRWLARNAIRLAAVATVCTLLIWASPRIGSWLRSDRDGGRPTPTRPVDSASTERLGAVRTKWDQYRDDYRAWMWPLAEALGPGNQVPAFLRTNLGVLLDPAQGRGKWEPTEVLGSQDPADVSQPSDRLLGARVRQLDTALQIRDRAVESVLTGYPAEFRRRLAETELTPLASFAADVRDRWTVAYSELASRLESKTNSPGPSSTGSVSAPLGALAQADRELAQLAEQWAGWTAVESRLSAFDTNMLKPVVDSELRGIGRGGAEGALSRLETLRRQGAGLAAWLVQSGSNVNREALRIAWQADTTNRTLTSWSNLAAGYLVGFERPDPRVRLRERVAQAEWDAMARDFAEAARGGVPVRLDWVRATNELAVLHDRRRQLEGLATERRNEDRVARESAALLEDYENWGKAAEPAWIELFDVRRLAEREAARDFGRASANRLWSNLVMRALAPTESGERRGSREAVVQWRGRLARANEVFGSLAKQPASWPDPEGPGFALTATGSAREELVERMREDYLEAVARRLIEPTLEVRLTLADYIASAEGRSDADAARAFARDLNLGLAFETALGAGTIPANVEGWRGTFLRLSGTNGFARTREHPVVQVLVADLALWPETGQRLGVEQDSSKLNRKRLAAVMALEVAPGGAARDLEGWKRCLRLYRAAAARSVGGPSTVSGIEGIGLRTWVEKCWRSTAGRLNDWDSVAEATAAADAAELPLSHRPASLTYLGQLGALIRGFDPARIPEFQTALRGLTNASAAPAAHSAVLARLMAASTEVGTDWEAIGPARVGFQAKPLTDHRVRFVRGDIALDFVRFDPPGSLPVFVAVTEVGAGLFLQATSELPGVSAVADPEWVSSFLRTLAALKKPLEGSIEGSQILSAFSTLGVGRDAAGKARLTVASQRFAGAPFAGSELLRRFATVAPDEPLNFVDAKVARRFAAALGCRLPTPGEWRTISTLLGRSGAENRSDPEFEKALDEIARVAKLHSPGGLRELFIARGEPTGRSDPADSRALLASVGDDRFAQGPLWHWRGNVAEWVEDGAATYVAGGSLASSFGTGASADLPRQVERAASERGYADVGFRLAFDWGGRRPVDKIRSYLAELKPAIP